MSRPEKSDNQLLAAYLQGEDSAAFEELYRRHAGLVYGTCLRRLGDPAEAEDAAAATFGILLRKARSLLGRRESLAGWLQWCAVNASRRAARTRARRAAHEKEAAEMRARISTEERRKWDRALPHLDAALAKLPGAQRDVLVMQYLQGRSRSQIAEELAVPEGTVAGRSRLGIKRLQGLLAGRGAALSCAVLGACLLETASEVAVPAGLAAKISALAAGGTATANVGALVEGTMNSLRWAKAKMILTVVCVATAITGGGILAASGPGPQAVPAAAPAGAKQILNGGSYWRFHLVRKLPEVTVAAQKKYGKGGAAPIVLKKLQTRTTMYSPIVADLPPENWAAAKFDDSTWARSRLVWMRGEAFGQPLTQRAIFRGKFNVTDPAGVELYLTLKYSGGITIHLNGSEVARAHLPEGTLRPDTVAELYPKEAWIGSDGKYLRGGRYARSAEAKKAEALRERTLGPVKLPKSLLRKGVNVLGIDVRRSSHHHCARKWKVDVSATLGAWHSIDIKSISLVATGSGAQPNLARQAGLQVWAMDRNQRMTEFDYPDPTEKSRPLRIVAARNGSWGGNVGVGSTTAIRSLTVNAGDLTAAKGGGKIPAANVTVLYGKFDQKSRSLAGWFDGLAAEPPAEVATRIHSAGRFGKGAKTPLGAGQLVYVRVRVPRGAKPGDYRGEVTVNANGKSVKLPVELKVHDWVVPDPADFRTYVDLYQSPTSVAKKYKVKLWSPEHWKLMEESWKLLGRAGNRLVITHLVEKSQYGNERGTVTFIRQKDGSYKYDFSIFEKYVKLAQKHCKRIDHVAVSIWHPGGWTGRKADSLHEITVRDGEAGELKTMKLPNQGTPEIEKIFKPALAALQAKLKELGLEKQMCIGHLCDSTAPAAVLKSFDNIWPGGGKARWMRGCHIATRETKSYDARGGGHVVLHEYCYGGGVRNPVYSQAHNYPGVFYFRAGYVTGEHRMPLTMYRTFAEAALAKGTRGVGRICLDLWKTTEKGQKAADGYGDIFNRYPHSSISQRRPTITRMSCPGPKGAMPTLRFEAFLEGVQDAEAVIYLDEAVRKHSAALGADLLARCRKLLSERDNYRTLVWTQYYKPVVIHPHHNGWQKLSDRGYALAAEVKKKLGK